MKKFLFFGTVLFLSLLFWGCSETKKVGKVEINPASIAKGDGNQIFEISNEQKAEIKLVRGPETFEFSAKKVFPLYSQDKISNLSKNDVTLSGNLDSCDFLLKPSTQVQIFPKSLIVDTGKMRLHFHKIDGVFQVKIPGATLGVRGTKFDILVRPDKSSSVVMLEGSVSVNRNSVESVLKEGETLQIGPNGASSEIVVPERGSVLKTHPDSKD